MTEEMKINENKLRDGCGADGLEARDELVDALTAENEALIGENERLRAETEKSAVYLEQLTILKKDFDNFKNRTRDAAEASKEEGVIFVIEKLLPVLDSFYRAEQSLKGKDELVPFNMVLKQFEKILAETGVEEIGVLGREFDPQTAEALAKEEVKKENFKGVVLEVYTKGYRYKNKVIRYAKVKVGV